MKKYLSRIIDKQLQLYLNSFGAVLVVGPKWCGKTTTCMLQANSVIKLHDLKFSNEVKMLIDVNPQELFRRTTPILIDEWQVIPQIWDMVRSEVDDRGEFGQFILTGSTVVVSDQIKHSGVGRIARLKMYPMSLYESGDSIGSVSITELFAGVEISKLSSNLSVERIATLICRGGWPSSISVSDAQSSLMLSSYIDSLCERDVAVLTKSGKNPGRVRSILRSYARNISTLASKSTIRKDTIANDINFSEVTFNEYVSTLEQLFVIEDVPAWSPSIRSKTAIRIGSKRGFSDPSLAASALNISPIKLLADIKTFRYLFESLVIRDLRIYLQNYGQVLYYHDRYGLEYDAVLQLKDGRYALVEVKLGSFEIDTAAKNLKKIATLASENSIQPPSFMAIITGGKFCYQREDGVYVIPIGCLKD